MDRIAKLQAKLRKAQAELAAFAESKKALKALEAEEQALAVHEKELPAPVIAWAQACEQYEKEVIDSLSQLQKKYNNKQSKISHSFAPVYRKDKEEDIQLTEEQQAAYDVLESGRNVFLTGKAGTGKSHLTRYFIHRMEQKRRNILVCAPTGIAALNIGGATLHRTFAAPTRLISPYEQCKSKECQKVIDKADIILIDEISMCRIDLFEFVVNSILESHERTGKKIQLVVIGDFFQLPPVLRYEDEQDYAKMYGHKLYAFESEKWQRMAFQCIELREVIRQKDHNLATALNNIRLGIPDFTLLSKRLFSDDDPEAITICGLNKEALSINQQRLAELKGRSQQYIASAWGWDDTVVPVDKSIELKKDARIILVANDREGRWVNGSLATVTKLLQDSIVVRLDNGTVHEVERYTWEIKEYHVHKRHDGTYFINTDIVGQFTQLPVKLAYAITIHRSQGQTYDKVNIHPDGIFAEGMLYVALSRCRSLEGMRIVGQLRPNQIIISGSVKNFYTTFLKQTPKVATQKGGIESVNIRTFSKSHGEEMRQEILKLIRNCPIITIDELAENLGIRRNAVQKHVNRLKDAGIIVRTGARKNGQWWVV